MFAANSGGRSLRNTRRRQRTSLDEAVKPPNAKRQRSTLRQGSGEGPVKTIADSDLQDNQQPADVDQQDSNGNKTKPEQNQQNIAFRGPRKHEKPAGQTDPTITLSSNDYYTVTKLPLPEQLLDFISGRARCVFNTKTGFALLLTESRALVWSYTAGTNQLDPETLPLSIPEWCTSDDTALMGTLVSNVTNAIPGLLVVAPSTGKLIYWESASNAAFVGIAKQKQSGLRGAIPGLPSGEHVTDVINAEPSGIILVLSSGRVAQVTTRDPQGKPGLTVNFLLRGYTSGGFFDGLRNVLGSGSWRKEIAEVRTGASLVRGQRDIYILSSSGLLEIWDSHWNNVNTLRAEIDIQEDIYHSLGLATDTKPNYSLRILDFVASHEESKTSQSGEMQQSTTLFFLALISQGLSTKILAVVKAETHHDSVEILSSHKIENPNIVNELETHKPKLHITRPSNTAFIVIGQKVWIVSILGLEPTPSAQLLDGGISKPFQDRVQFQSGDKYEIIGTGSNAEGVELENPTCILMLRGYGLISVSALSSQLEDGGVASVTAKQKIEQAVFFGTMTNTPLSFNDDGELTFSAEELETAALEICNDVLQSNARFIPHATMSIDHNLRIRSKALSDLAAELLRRRAALSRRVRWELLWAGEKLAAQRAIWKLEEEFQKTWKPETFLSRAIGLMNEKFRTKHDSIKTSEKDHVRQWFFHDTFQMQHIIPWIFNAIRGSKGPGGRTSAAFLAQVYQASELSLAALESAFRFREDHALQYGLGDEVFENGVLLSSYADLPEFWTSENMVYSETGSMLDLELESSRSWQQPTSNAGQSDSDMLPQVAKNSCRRLYVLNMMLDERTRWLFAQNDPKLKDEGISMKETNYKQRQWQLYKMAGIGQLQGAISLAEEFRDMGALVELMVELQDQIKSHEADAEAKSALPVKDMPSFSQKIGEYFDSFGEQWAEAFFSRQIKGGQPGVLLSMKDYQVHVTRFLRKFPSYSRLAWVNDILGEEDYKTASDALEKLALTQEANLWDKRVQLSLAKITKLASWEQTDSLDKTENKIWRTRLDELGELAGIQELLYEHILPAMHGAIDPKAELELAMEHFGNRVSDRPALKEVLEEHLTRLIRGQALNAEQLINLMTLMDDNVQFLEGEESEAFNREFFIALRVLRLSDYATSDPAGYNYLQRLIWRRCITRDNWCTILESQSQSDDDRKSKLRGTALVKTLAECMAEESSQRPATDDLYRLGQPSEAIQFGSYELIRNRFRAEQWPYIERDLNLEIDTLRRFIEEGQLDLWYPELLKLVQEDFAGMRAH